MACEPCSSAGGDQGLAADGGSDAQPCLVQPAFERGLADPVISAASYVERPSASPQVALGTGVPL